MYKDDGLFQKIKDHLQRQAKEGGRIDTEMQLCERFGVTRYRIRKELDVLTQMGILERSPKRGTKVREMGENVLKSQIQERFDIANFDVQEFLEARILIECSLIEIVTRRLTPQMYSRLEACLIAIEKNADQALIADENDRNFHLLLLEACGNRVLQVFSSVLVAYFDRTSDKVATLDQAFFLDCAKKERQILLAIRKNDAQKATELLREHLLEQSGYFAA
ncbi:MAG TPA: FadR family transcriptional regulator [Sutterella sp.]|nr:FadR family transcriptional regulator [Sutterella sp.]